MANMLPGGQTAIQRLPPKPKPIETLRQHKLLFGSILFTGLLLTAAYVGLSHKKYESDMSIMIQNSRKNTVISADPTAASQPIATQVSEEDVNSAVEVLGSSDVLDDVVDPGWTQQNTHPTQAQAEHEGKVSTFRKRLIVSPVRKSHVIDVSFVATDPRQATLQLNRLLDVFMTKQKALSQPMGVSKFFEDEAERYKTQWSEAQQKLANFQEQHKFVTVADKEADISRALADAMTLQRSADAEISEVQHRLGVVGAQLRSVPQRQNTTERVVPAAGSLDQVNILLAQLNLRRAQLLTQYQPTDRMVQQVDSQIAEAQNELTRLQTNSTTERATGVNPTWQIVDQNYASENAHLRAVTGRRDALTAQINDLQNQLKALVQDELEFKTLQQNANTLNTNYQLYIQKRDSARMSAAMDNSGLLNFGVVQYPTFSLSPVRPRPMIDSLLGIMTSLFLASMAVYFVSSRKHEAELEAAAATEQNFPYLEAVAKMGALDTEFQRYRAY